jgi:type I restriction enzyme M protein
LLTAELATKVDAVWSALASEGQVDPLGAVGQITRLISGDPTAGVSDQIRGDQTAGGPAVREVPGRGGLRFPRPGFRGRADPGGSVDSGADSSVAAAPSSHGVDRATQGGVYEYLLGKLAASGDTGPLITPGPIVDLMAEMTAPTPRDTIIDPAVGTGSLLVAAGGYLRDHHPEMWLDPRLRDHFNNAAFTGVDSDASLCGIAIMNLQFHGVQNPSIVHADSLSEELATTGAYSLVLANPPLGGLRTSEPTAKALLTRVRSKKVELLFLVHALGLLAEGGRAAVIVPDSLLSGASKAHREVRRMLVEEYRLEAVVRLPAGVFAPHSGVASSILFVRKAGTTDSVWFYDVRNAGFSLDGERTPTEADDLPDVLTRWKSLNQASSAEPARTRNAQSFVVRAPELAEQGFDLTFARYRVVVADYIAHRSPNEILIDIARLELRIQQAAAALARSLGDAAIRRPQ